MPEQASLSSVNGFGGGGGQFAVEVGFVKGPVAHTRPIQGLQTAAEPGPVADATDHQRGMFELRREESLSGFEDSVTGLHRLLRRGQVAPDEDVNVRTVINLSELHEEPPGIVRAHCSRLESNQRSPI